VTRLRQNQQTNRNNEPKNRDLVLVIVMFLTVGLAVQAHPDWIAPFPLHWVIGNIYCPGLIS
jgi:hypothetical protein